MNVNDWCRLICVAGIRAGHSARLGLANLRHSHQSWSIPALHFFFFFFFFLLFFPAVTIAIVDCAVDVIEFPASELFFFDGTGSSSVDEEDVIDGQPQRFSAGYQPWSQRQSSGQSSQRQGSLCRCGSSFWSRLCSAFQNRQESRLKPSKLTEREK